MAPSKPLTHFWLAALTLSAFGCATSKPQAPAPSSSSHLQGQRSGHAQRLATLANARLAAERPTQAAMLAKLASLEHQKSDEAGHLELPIWRALGRALSEPRFSVTTTLRGARAAWSPRSAAIAIIGLDGAVTLAEAPDFTPRPLRGRATALGPLLWSPDGAFLAALHGDRLMRWSRDDLSAAPTPFVAPESLLVAALNDDGTPVALTAQGELIALQEGRPPRVLATPGDGQARWSPDARSLVIRRPDGALVLWRPQTREGRRWSAHTLRRDAPEDAPSPSWHPQGKRLAIATNDGEVVIWDVTAAQPQTTHIKVPTEQARSTQTIQWTQDGSHLIVTDTDTHLYILNPDDRSRLRRVSIPDGAALGERSERTSPTSVDGTRLLSTDGERLFVSGSAVPGAVATWPPPARMKEVKGYDREVSASPTLSLSSDLRWLALQSREGAVTFMSRRPPAARPYDVKLPGDALALSPDAAFVAAGHHEEVSDVVSLPDLKRHKLPVSGAWRGWSAAGDRLALGSAPGVIRVLGAPLAHEALRQDARWEVEASLSAPFDCQEGFWLAPDQPRALCVSSGGALATWRWESSAQGTSPAEVEESRRWSVPAGVVINAVAWGPGGVTVVADAGRIFALSQRGAIEVAGFEGDVQMIWRGETLWVQTDTGALWRWAGATPNMEVVPLFERIRAGGALGERAAARLLASRGGRWVGSARPEEGATIQLRDTEDPHAAPLHLAGFHRSGLDKVAWSEDDRWLAMTGGRGQVRLWELGAGMAFEWRLEEGQEAQPWSPHWGHQGRSLSLSRRHPDTGRPVMVRRRAMGPALLEAVCEDAHETLDWTLWSRSGIWREAQYDPVCPEAALHPSVGAALAEAAHDQTLDERRVHFSDALWPAAKEAALEVLRGELSARELRRSVLRAIQRLEATP